MTAPALDVVLGAYDAVTAVPPRLEERANAAWQVLGAALTQGHTAVAAPQLAFLARHRLVTLPPDLGRAQQLARLVGSSQSSYPALLLLSRWAHSLVWGSSQPAASLLSQLVGSTLEAHAAGVASDGPTALFLAAACVSRACEPAARRSTWDAALHVVQTRQQGDRRVCQCVCRVCQHTAASSLLHFTPALLRAAEQVPETLAACGYLLVSANDSPRAERAAAAALALAPRTMSHGLLCFRLFSALSSAIGDTARRALVAATSQAAACETPAAVLACAGALCGSASSPGDAQLIHALQHCIQHAAGVAAHQDGDLSPGRAALTGAVALAVARLAAASGARPAAGRPVSTTFAGLLDGPMLQCLTSAVFHPHAGAAVHPLRSLAQALSSSGMSPPQPHVLNATLSRTMQEPCVMEAGTLVRLLCDAAVAAPASPAAAALLDAVCACAASSGEAYSHIARALPPLGSDGAQAFAQALGPAAQLPFLVVSSFCAGAREVYVPRTAAPSAAAGRILDALGRVDVGRTQHGASPPAGYSQLLESAASHVASHAEAACALMRAIPPPGELRAPWTHGGTAMLCDSGLLARCVFLLRALPFVLPVTLVARRTGGREGAAALQAEMRHLLLDAVAPFALAFAGSPAAGQPACRAAHVIMRALLVAVPAAEFPGKAEVALTYAQATLEAFPGVPPDALAVALDAALRAIPAQQVGADAHGGSPHLALLHALATRLHETQGADDDAARALRVALFRTLGAMPPRALNAALPVYEDAVRRLHPGARQEALDTLCGACTRVGLYHKRRCVDWCLALAASL